MEQHPVPQNITGFQFKLIGDMTIRQFIFLASGIIGGYLVTTFPWPAFFKWPLAAILGFSGFAFAFMPIEERSLDRWFISFFKAIYAPTQFIWKKTPPQLDWFISSQMSPPPPPPKEEPKRPESKLKEYLKTLPVGTRAPLDENERLALQKLDFSIGGNVIPQIPEKPPLPPSFEETYPEIALPKVRVRKLKPSSISGEIILNKELKIPKRELKIPQIDLAAAEKALEVKTKAEEQKEEAKSPSLETPIVTTPVRKIFEEIEEAHPFITPRFVDIPKKEEKKAPEIDKESREEMDKLKLQNEILNEQIEKFKKNIEDLQKFAVQTDEGKIRLKEMLAQFGEAQKQKEQAINELATLRRSGVGTEPAKEKVTPTTAIPKVTPRVQFVPQDMTKKQGLPTLTQTPNVISGMVTDPQGGILPNVIITIKDSRDNPVRAMKTNQVGQFKSSTPLANGTYTVELEKDNYEFDIIALEVKGQVLPPLEIRAK